MKLPTRSALFALALTAGAVPLLQGCFPAVVVGVGATALMAADRRTSGAYLEDEGIEVKASNRITERFGDKVHVNVTSYNRNVLLTGETPDAQTKAELDKIVGTVSNVRGVTNEVQISGISSLGTRSTDAFLTSKVKARFIDGNKFPTHLVKVVSESSTVYLLGLVTRKEADDAALIASTTGGVQRVVRVFEYITLDQAKELDRRKQTDPSTSR